MDYTLTVCVAQCASEVTQYRQRIASRQRPSLVHSCAERFAFDVRHRVPGNAVCHSCSQHWNDVRMLKRCCQPHFARETLGTQPGGELAAQDFDYDVASECLFVREEHPRHSTAAELALYGVGVSEGGLEALAEVHPNRLLRRM